VQDVAPHRQEYEQRGLLPREFWQGAAALGLLGLQVPEEFGGTGSIGFKYNALVTEEAQRAGLSFGELRLQTDVCMPYFLRYTTPEQKGRWLPRITAGEATAAIAMSEPDTGSDLRSIATRAERDGPDYVVNGAKTFISNGSTADLIITVARTGVDSEAGRPTHSLLVVERGMEGFSSGKQLEKIGLKGQDVAELSYQDVRVPASNLLGNEGEAFTYLTSNLPQERLSIAVNSQMAAVVALEQTIEYVKERKAFGVPIASFQNTKFELAACAAEVEAGQALLDKALEAHETGELEPGAAAAVKLFASELQGRVVDRCLQLYGGYGYILEYPIARAYADARVTRVYGGSSEIMKVLIARAIGL
jgi:alkylation response protein AidB-like acyl-CoA dehydrogenase